MARNNRVCCVCGKEYYYCSNDCMDSVNKPSWLGSFCCENCRNVYNACACYNVNKMSKDEAKEILDNCDLSNKKNFTPAAQRLIAEIYHNDDVIVEELKDDKNYQVNKEEHSKKQSNNYYKKYKSKKNDR